MKLKVDIKVAVVVLLVVVATVTLVLLATNNKKNEKVDKGIESEVKNENEIVEVATLNIGVTDEVLYDFVTAIRGSNEGVVVLNSVSASKEQQYDLIVYNDIDGKDNWIESLIENKDIIDKDMAVDLSKVIEGYRDYSNVSLKKAIEVVNHISSIITQLDLANS